VPLWGGLKGQLKRSDSPGRTSAVFACCPRAGQHLSWFTGGTTGSAGSGMPCLLAPSLLSILASWVNLHSEVSLRFELCFFAPGGAADQGVLHLYDKGRTNLCGGSYVRQCRLPGSCHPSSHKVKKTKVCPGASGLPFPTGWRWGGKGNKQNTSNHGTWRRCWMYLVDELL